MKKFATLAVLATLAISAQAASVMWGFGGKVYLNDGTDTVLSSNSSAPAVADGSYLALVYLGQNVTSYDLADITAAKVVDQLNYDVAKSGKTSNIGKWNPNTSTYDDTSMASGASFTVLFYNAASSSFDYIYALSGSDKGAAYDSNILTVVNDNMAIANASIYGTVSSGNAGVVVAAAPIPEPGTAAMALLGLGLLIRRRKA